MKRKSLVLAVLTMAATLNAMDFKIDDKIRLTQSYTDDITAMGSEIIVEGNTRGNLFMLGGELIQSGEAHNSVYMLGGEALFEGLAWENVYIMGGDIFVNGKVHGNLNVFGGSIELGEDAEIFGMVKIRAGEAILNGRIDGPVNIKAEDVSFLGTINNDVSVDAKNVNRDFGSLVTGSFDEGEFDEDWDFFNRREHRHRRGFSLAFFISSLLIGLLWQRLFPENLSHASTILKQKTVSMTLWGIIYMVVIPIFAIVLLVGVVTIPVSFILMSGFAFSLFLGQFPVAMLFGNLVGRNSEAFRRAYLPLIVGLIILHLGLKIPVVNVLLMIFWIISGFGAIWFTIVNDRKRKAAPVLNQSTQTSEPGKKED